MKQYFKLKYHIGPMGYSGISTSLHYSDIEPKTCSYLSNEIGGGNFTCAVHELYTNSISEAVRLYESITAVMAEDSQLRIDGC